MLQDGLHGRPGLDKWVGQDCKTITPQPLQSACRLGRESFGMPVADWNQKANTRTVTSLQPMQTIEVYNWDQSKISACHSLKEMYSVMQGGLFPHCPPASQQMTQSPSPRYPDVFACRLHPRIHVMGTFRDDHVECVCFHILHMHNSRWTLSSLACKYEQLWKDSKIALNGGQYWCSSI